MKDNIDKHRKAIYIAVFVALLLALSPILVPMGYVLFLVVFLDYSGPRWDTPFPVAHQRAITTFVESAGFGSSRLPRKSTHWFERSVVLEQGHYTVADLNLIGLTPELGDRRFDFIPPKKDLAKITHRPLTPEEADAVAQLRAGKPWVKLLVKPGRLPAVYEGVTHRVIAPVPAQESCLECHQVKPATLLGAFEYWLRKQEQPVESPAPEKKTET